MIGQNLWKKAKKYIASGNMLLSKNPDLFLPKLWPVYFKKTKGCYIWDLEKKKYLDMSTMSVGTNVLGYSNPQVDKAVKKVVANGNMSTLNCAEEVYLSEELVKIHRWASFAKLARTGAEANSIAIRIARSFSKKKNIAICGYHGWHDWYLSANITSKNNLKKHLLPGLSSSGIPKELRNTVHPFDYNCIESFKKVIKSKKIGIVMMEVARTNKPKKNFLHKIRKICNKNNITLIFDECTTGFRENYGGMHKIYRVNPDIAVFGKALGNGYAITAVIGKKKYKKSAESSFMSSTFWTERIGPVAALKTLEIMKKTKPWNNIIKNSSYLRLKIKTLAKKNNIDISISEVSSILSFSFKSKFAREFKTYLTQEMLKHKIIAGTSIYLSASHNKKILHRYLFILNKIFKDLEGCKSKKDIYKLLETSVCHLAFQRIN
jgi:glutamate-1-semialdehyde 2,1-aminomutase